jgi:hypothetical protein
MLHPQKNCLRRALAEIESPARRRKNLYRYFTFIGLSPDDGSGFLALFYGIGGAKTL